MSVLVSPPARDISRPPSRGNTALHGLAWVIVLIGAGLSKILCHQFGWHAGLWLPSIETVFFLGLAAAAPKIPGLGDLRGFILAVAAANFGWHVAVPWIEGLNVVRSLSQDLSWGGQFFVSRVIRTSGALLTILTLIGSGLTSRDLFLRIGDWRAQVQPEPFLSRVRGMSWARFAVIILLFFSVLLPAFLFFTLHPQLGRVNVFLSALPWAVATSLLNAASEEFQFRSVLLARLRNAVPSAEAMLLIAVFFGLTHYFGQPGGWAGVLMAGIAGWIWAKSMIETRGFMWAFLIHFVQDFVIFGFLAMAGASFPRS
jgi:membrane protease YdiL (CAAX protease family)